MEKKFSNKGRRGSSSSFDKKRPFDKDKSFTRGKDDKPSFRKPSGIRTKQDDKFDVEKFTGVKPRSQGGFKRSSEGSFDKPFERKPFEKREGSFERKPFEKREGSFERKPFEKREGSFERKPFEKREGSFERKPFEKREGSFERKPFEKREGGRFEKKPFEKREGSFNKSSEKPYDKRTDKVAAFKERKEMSKNRNISTPNYDFQRFKNIEAGLKDNKFDTKGKKKGTEFDEVASENGEIRLNRFIANAGVCSRREADVLIQAGRVKINGAPMKEMGYRVKLIDSVYLDDEPLKKERVIYVLLNKPKDHITTTEDPEGRKTVMNLVKQACNERIYPVGRLDRNTTGLLLMTNDGALADKLAHPSNNIKKVYQILLAKPITEDDFNQIAAGVTLEDGETKVDKISIISEDATAIEVHIHSGKNRIVRRIFEHFDYDILRLDRVAYAGITKKGIERGEWRYLTEQEVIRLKYFVK